MAADRIDIAAAGGGDDFEHDYWRSAPRLDELLGPLTPGLIDDEQFRLLADNIPTLCWIANGDGYIVWYNRRWHDYCGTTPEEMEGWGWQSVHDPALLPDVMERWTASIATGQPFEMTFPLRGADGVYRPFLTRIQPVRDASGKVVRWFGVNTEISAQVAAEKALRTSEAQARLIADSLPVMIAYVDADQRYRFTNKAYENWFGRPRDAFVGASLRDVLGEEAYVQVRPMAERALAGERLIYEMPLPHGDGSIRAVEVQCIPDQRRDGSVLGYYVLVQDISERKNAEGALLEQSRNLEILNRTGAALAAELDLEKLVQMVTDAGVELTGAEFGAFFYNVLDETGESYLLYTLSGVDRSAFDKFPMPRNTAVFGPTFRGEGVVRSDDITKDPRYGRNSPRKGMPEGHLPVKSYLAVPVISRSGEVLGGLFFGHSEPGRFTGRHEQLMIGIAAQAAIGIDNARLFQSAQREIEERRRAEEALRESEARFRELADNISQFAWTADGDGNRHWYNRRWYEFTGTTPEEMEGQGWRKVHHPDSVDEMAGKLSEAFHAGRPWEETFRLRGRDGDYRWFLTRAVPIRDESGRVLRWFGTNTDVTELREAERALRENEERLRLVQAAGGIGSFDYDLQRDDAICSPEYYRLFGLPDGYPINRETWETAIYPEDRDKALEALDRSIAERRPFDYEYRIIRADTGEVRWLSGRAAILFDAEDRPWRYVGGNIDITQRRASEEALRQSEERLRLTFDNVQVGICETGLDARLRRTNDTFCRILGYEPGELDGWSIRDFTHPDDRARDAEGIEQLVSGEIDTYKVEKRYITKDGRLVWADLRSKLLRGADGEPLYILSTIQDITARVAAEQALRESEARWRGLFENMMDGFFIGEAIRDEKGRMIDWHYVEVNPAFEDLTGIPPGEAIGRRVTELFPNIPTQFIESYARVVDTGEPAQFERHNPALGEGRWYDVRARRIGEDRFTALFFDITERKLAEERQRLSSARFLEAIDATGSRMGALIREKDWSETPLGPPDRWPTALRSALGIGLNSAFPVCIYWGPDFLLLYNDPWSSIPGDKHPWALGKPAREAWADIWDIIGPMFRQVMETGIANHTVDGLLPMQRHGYVEECYFNYNVSPIYGEDGRVAGLFNSVIETTYRVLAERRAELLRLLADRGAAARTVEEACAQAAEAVASDPADIPFCLIYLIEGSNGNSRAVLVGSAGLGPGEARPETIALAGESALWPLAEAARSRQPVDVDDLAERLDAPLVLDPWPEPIRSASVLPLVDPARPAEPAGFLVAGLSPRRALDEAYRAFLTAAAGHVATGIGNARAAEDERRTAEELERRVAERTAELERAQEALRQAQKMEAVGQLTGGIAHDFNNLLTVVIGNIDMGRRALAENGDARTRRALDNAARGAERAAALTQRLLAFARRQPLSPRPLEADKLVAGMSDLLGRSLGETIDLEIVAAPGLWRVEADPNQLESAILNLAVNARDAMPEGGKLTIETVNAHIDERYTAAHAEVTPGHYVVIAVTDTGRGMPKDVLSRVFEPFFTTKEVGKGTGLGLSQVYGFVKQSGGHVNIYSEEGHGTTVKVYLPRLAGEGADEEEEGLCAVEVSPAAETLLVVEDDDDVRAYTVELLREIGYRVLEAHDGPSALSLLERQEQPVDLLFTDVVMPGMSGRELAEEARKLQPGLKVLYTSGYTRDAIVHGGRLDPGVDLIGKPFTYLTLGRKVRDLLDARQ